MPATAPARDWFYYVNGVLAPRGAATTAVHRGDRIWWDLHDWRATDTIPAVVGSYPGAVRHRCRRQAAPDHARVRRRPEPGLQAGRRGADARPHVPVASQLIGTGSGPDTLGVVVGTWSRSASEVAAALIAHGPSASGVYARFTGPAGRRWRS